MIKRFTVKGNNLACWVNPENFGEQAQSFIFLHGSGGNSGAWSFQYAKLHQRYNIAAVDLSGHGQSEGKGHSAISSYVSDLKELLETLRLNGPILVGHSLGAAIALDFASQFPQQISAVVTVGGGATMPVNPDIIAGFRREPQGVLDLMVKFSLAKENRAQFYDALRASLSEADVEVTAGDMTACNQFDVTASLAKIQIPTLVVCGSEDKMTPLAASQRLVADIPGAQMAVIEHAGHMVMMEQPEAFNKTLTDFAAGLPPKSQYV